MKTCPSDVVDNIKSAFKEFVVEQFPIALEFMAKVKFDEAVAAKKLEIGELALAAASANARAKSAKNAFDEAIEEFDTLIAGGWEAFHSQMQEDLRDERDAATGATAEPSAPTAVSKVDEVAKEMPSDAWKAASIVELIQHGAPKGAIEKLSESGYDTIGRFENLRADIAMGREKWPKGIGEAKITKLEDAVCDWLRKNRDRAVFDAIAETPPAATESEPEKVVIVVDGTQVVPFAVWEAWSDEQREEWLVKRSAFLHDNEPTNYDGPTYMNGRADCRNGKGLADVSWTPGDIQDAWLFGWMAEATEAERKKAKLKKAQEEHRKTVTSADSVMDL